AESEAECRAAGEKLGYPVVMKPVMSSSGKGQSVVHDAGDIAKAWRYANEGMRGDRPRVIIEEFIRFDYEITLLTVRQQHGPTLYCAPIGHRQERGDYQESWQPQAMPPDMLTEAQRIAGLITDNLGGAGIFGVEFFVAKDRVIFSELSPRPHDTGMVTLISQNLSEFDLHARAVLGLPIPHIEVYGPSASHVVLADGYGDGVAYQGVEEAMAIPSADVRIFRKPNTRPHRRMAVCLARGTSIDEAKARATRASELVKVTSQ
ncbi:MAG: formate-dependent phosphoribosylglycinamide formyltransferase, partial [Chloroflexi bacterium]|nr:formate-dependent phosphoribosylglycinamide formyltransferase [Chloroflexota bacterium]